MIIDSKFHDYYDGAHDGYIDKTIVYNRQTLEYKGKIPKEIIFPDLDGHTYFRSNCSKITLTNEWDKHKPKGIYAEEAQLFIVGFAGKLYVGLCHLIIFTEQFKEKYKKYYYDLPNMLKILKLDDENIAPDKRKRLYKQRKQNFIEFYNKINGQEKISEFFITNRTPVFYYGYYYNGKYSTEYNVYRERSNDLTDLTIVLNPNLKEIELFKLLDPATTFRGIATYISNILTNTEKEAPVLSDKLKILSKGFDYVTSFRKQKQK